MKVTKNENLQSLVIYYEYNQHQWWSISHAPRGTQPPEHAVVKGNRWWADITSVTQVDGERTSSGCYYNKNTHGCMYHRCACAITSMSLLLGHEFCQRKREPHLRSSLLN